MILTLSSQSNRSPSGINDNNTANNNKITRFANSCKDDCMLTAAAAAAVVASHFKYLSNRSSRPFMLSVDD